ncbi:MAG TPA: hypothetical protein VN694_12155 [Caulobacteraceae bacterium]|nr:hypothetical protein [Caulobacteraceae bacterium]
MRRGWSGGAALLVMAAAALAACSKPAVNATANAAEGAANAAAATASAAASAAGAAANAAATVAGAAAGPIQLSALPAPTAGEWTRVSSQDGGAAQTSAKCFDGKPIDPTDGLPGKCASMTAERTATGGFKVVGDCPSNGIDAKMTLAGEGDFKKSFTMDSQMTMSGGPGGDMTLKNHSVYTYVGPVCAK